jgi:diadenosine tetraphosphate (Ap4A) HIT family hydrolase
MTRMFVISPDITRSASPLLDLPLCTVLLKEDARWPWLILAPRREGLEHLTDLDAVDMATAMDEVRAAFAAVRAEEGVERVNLGVLGNVAPQLHLHVVGRWAGDPAWPGPVWGVEGRTPYAPEAREALAARLRGRLAALA